MDRGDGRWILQAGDAYFHHGEMDLQRTRCPPGLRFYQWMMEQDRSARLANQRRLRDLKRDHGSRLRVMSSHDIHEFEVAARHPFSEPANARLTMSTA